MLLKTRIRVYKEEQVEGITKFLLDNALAQNVTREQQFLTGDFVYAGHTVYVKRVKTLNNTFNVEAEILVG
jgi:hypothetical protein